jgi:signal transduction histidine kinase
VPRSLRVQLIIIVVVIVATVRLFSQWVHSRFVDRALENDVRARAELVLRTADWLWGRTDPLELRERLVTVVNGDREIDAIDILRFDGEISTLEITTRNQGARQLELSPAEVTRLSANEILSVPEDDLEGVRRMRLIVPIRRDGSVRGAAQAALRPGEIARLQRRIRQIDVSVLISSIIIVSGLLTLLLDRRVTRPVAALVNGMQQAEAGERGVRVESRGAGEFQYLTQRFNSLVAKAEALTENLEAKVEVATRGLAEKNAQLQAVNESLWRATLEISRSERLAALGQMAGTIAHELGTPLNSALGYVQLLREDLPAGHLAKLTVVESQLQRMSETIRSVLDRTRDVPLRRTPVPIGPLISEALNLISVRLAERDLSATVEIDPDLPGVPADAVALRQVLLNFLTNAIDATGPGGSITVAARRLSRGDNAAPWVELSVRDTGQGMSPDEVRRVFEPFYTTKAPERGSGLGLVIVDHIIKAHGGEFDVESQPGKGTTASVRLPLEI